MSVHFGEQLLFLLFSLLALGQQMRFVSLFDFALDSPNCEPEAALFCDEFYDTKFVELLLASQALEYAMLAQHCAMFAIVIEFGENRAIFLKIHNRLSRRAETLFQRRAIE